ncbi:uncharacterized protein G2W53_010954 [Senna tora]|uniref:Uncharacterized protein n=1 Tax=Senna tora TaxID=362788 RepID=A0A834X1V3_9FABA|nr:uncharacterized protein G2W53_010954 [Senna tora]
MAEMEATHARKEVSKPKPPRKEDGRLRSRSISGSKTTTTDGGDDDDENGGRPWSFRE